MRYREAPARIFRGNKAAGPVVKSPAPPDHHQNGALKMVTQEQNEQDTAARMELSRLANLEISKLAEAASDICKDEDHPIFHGIMARIRTLSEIIFFAQKLHGHEDGDKPSTQDLERAYMGLLA